jgi:hypothetical protein
MTLELVLCSFLLVWAIILQLQESVPVYSNLIFKFKVFQSEENDHDFDNVPSHLEDINGNTDLTDDNSDDDSVC